MFVSEKTQRGPLDENWLEEYSTACLVFTINPTIWIISIACLNKRGIDPILRHIGLLEVDEDKIRKIRPKGTQVRMLYVPREAIRP